MPQFIYFTSNSNLEAKMSFKCTWHSYETIIAFFINITILIFHLSKERKDNEEVVGNKEVQLKEKTF